MGLVTIVRGVFTVCPSINFRIIVQTTSGKYVQKIEMDNILTHAPLHIIYATGLFSRPKKEGLRVQ